MADADRSTPNPDEEERCVYICQHRSCTRNGSPKVLEAFQNADTHGVVVKPSGCMGQCSCGPTVRVTQDETWYYRVSPEDVPKIVEQHFQNGEPVDEKLNPRIHMRFSF
jgi:(2Fe-2S) ferredoxin